MKTVEEKLEDVCDLLKLSATEDEVDLFLFQVIKNKLDVDFPRVDCEFDQTTGKTHITVHKPEICWADDGVYDRLVEERDSARAIARVLAHAYEHESRPPPHMVKEALEYPVISESVRRKARRKKDE